MLVQKPYFGGMRRCGVAGAEGGGAGVGPGGGGGGGGGDEAAGGYDASQLVCGACSAPVSGVSKCKLHGTDFIGARAWAF